MRADNASSGGTYRINKTLSFTSKDKELVDTLQKQGKFEKGFNFNEYVKNLIKMDVGLSVNTFTQAQKNEIISICNSVFSKLATVPTSPLDELTTSPIKDEFLSKLDDIKINADEMELLCDMNF